MVQITGISLRLLVVYKVESGQSMCHCACDKSSIIDELSASYPCSLVPCVGRRKRLTIVIQNIMYLRMLFASQCS